MNTNCIFVACIVIAMLAVSASTNDDENIVSVSESDIDQECEDMCRKENPDVCELLGNKISHHCMAGSFPCYYNCTVGETDQNHGINIYQVSKMVLNKHCFRKCMSDFDSCEKGDFVSQACMDDCAPCYAKCVGAE
ncbi:hypothetical protein CAPTEDRAFT_192381 [Capitella teleta]|uniref:Uncharacterized protein n=1 Tax=Capitella teleta TaxID=283909 RepID=R7TTK1_CAPTE|nr:hypothetical protein CAPTEDRAFT_192381 [Capitella teleta]|eukprot:ELT97243.1 hypothetical protein CAPTEDRAFT_192381 [Capitella teleta]